MASDFLTNKQLITSLEVVMTYLVTKLKERSRLQGHYSTGKLWRSIKFTINIEQGAIVGNILMEHYGPILDTGIKASSIPFSGTRKRGGVSKYIQGLAEHFRNKGLPPGESLEAAFRTAYVQSRQGMPTRASKRFSQDNGNRTGFITRTMEEEEQNITAMLTQKSSEELEVNLTRIFRPSGSEEITNINISV